MTEMEQVRAMCVGAGMDERCATPKYKRETPVDGCINCGEANDGGYMSGFEGDADEGAVGPFCSQCWELMRETFSSRAAEDQDHSQCHDPVCSGDRRKG
jgi:hypothetical protein